jgi:hypothetical protein
MFQAEFSSRIDFIDKTQKVGNHRVGDLLVGSKNYDFESNNFFTTKAKKSHKGHNKQPLCAFAAFVVTSSAFWSNKVLEVALWAFLKIHFYFLTTENTEIIILINVLTA